MLKALGHGAKGKHFRFRHGFLRRAAVAQYAGQLRHLGDPASVNLFLAFNGEIHDRTPVEGCADCNPFRASNIEEYLPKVACPVLALHGEDDEYGTPAQVEAIRRQAAGEVEVLMFADCRHSPHKDQPQAMIEAMAGFIERIR